MIFEFLNPENIDGYITYLKKSNVGRTRINDH